MNAHVTERELADAVDAGLSGFHRPRPEMLADLHRRELARAKQIIANHKRAMKSGLATLSADRKAAKAAYEAELARIAEDEADLKAKVDAAVSEETGLIIYHQAALDALAE